MNLLHFSNFWEKQLHILRHSVVINWGGHHKFFLFFFPIFSAKMDSNFAGPVHNENVGNADTLVGRLVRRRIAHSRVERPRLVGEQFLLREKRVALKFKIFLKIIKSHNIFPKIYLILEFQFINNLL